MRRSRRRKDVGGTSPTFSAVSNLDEGPSKYRLGRERTLGWPNAEGNKAKRSSRRTSAARTFIHSLTVIQAQLAGFCFAFLI